MRPSGPIPCGGRAQRLTESMRTAHALASQHRRGARHNASYVDPKGAQRSFHQAKRSVATGAIRHKAALCGMPKAFPPQGLCLCVALFMLTAQRGGKRGTSEPCST